MPGRAGDANDVTHHGRSSTSVTYTQASTCALWRLTTMGLAFDVESSRALASAASSSLNSPVSTTISPGWENWYRQSVPWDGSALVMLSTIPTSNSRGFARVSEYGGADCGIPASEPQSE